MTFALVLFAISLLSLLAYSDVEIRDIPGKVERIAASSLRSLYSPTILYRLPTVQYTSYFGTGYVQRCYKEVLIIKFY